MDEPDEKGEVKLEAEKGPTGPEPKTPQAEAKNASSGSEPLAPERPPRRPRKTRIEGSKRLACRRCDHFLGEVKSDSFEFLVTCHYCKTENHFAFTGLG